MRRLGHLLAIAAAALALAACSSTTLTRLAYANAAFAYTNLGGMVTWMVDDYVDLNDVQEDWVRERLARALEWHRTHELPRYRRFLEEALDKSAAPFEARYLAAQHAALRGHYYRLMEALVPDVAEFLAGIDAAQVAQMERKFAEENRKFVRESIRGTPEERRERRERRLVSHLEAWLGPLADPQRALVDAYYRASPDLSEELLGERRHRQTEILALARAKPPKPELQAQLHKLLVETDSWRRPEYARALAERDARTYAMMAELSASLAPRQRAALQSRIRGLLRDISTLTAAS